VFEVGQTTEFRRCAACGGRNGLNATACEFCARLLKPSLPEGVGAAVAPALRRYPPSTWLLAILTILVVLSVLIVRWYMT
jgi:hypothetical protein